MGYSEKEVWRMTYRKLNLLFDEWCLFYGIELQQVDDVVPGEDVV